MRDDEFPEPDDDDLAALDMLDDEFDNDQLDAEGNPFCQQCGRVLAQVGACCPVCEPAPPPHPAVEYAAVAGGALLFAWIITGALTALLGAAAGFLTGLFAAASDRRVFGRREGQAPSWHRFTRRPPGRHLAPQPERPGLVAWVLTTTVGNVLLALAGGLVLGLTYNLAR